MRRSSKTVSAPYNGMDGDNEIRNMTWYREHDAQSYLDSLAKRRNWRSV